jgi:hypothetical protein
MESMRGVLGRIKDSLESGVLVGSSGWASCPDAGRYPINYPDLSCFEAAAKEVPDLVGAG